MGTTESKSKFELIEENQRLKAELSTIKASSSKKKRRNRKFYLWAVKFSFRSFLLGENLNQSILKLYEEIGDNKVTKVTLAKVSAALIHRITKVGRFALLISIPPFLLLLIQVGLLFQQNRKIDIQNSRIEQQTYLQEADRRSSLIFLFGDVMQDIDKETRNGKNSLSKGLIGRIISLSHAFKPYTYLDGDSMIDEPLSPERGQLLFALLESNLDSNTYVSIFERGDFSYSELKGFNLSNKYLPKINLSYANLEGADLSNTYIEFANFNYSKMKGVNLKSSKIFYSHFKFCDLSKSKFGKSIVKACIFNFSNLDFIDFSISRIYYSSLENTSLKKANFSETWTYYPYHYGILCKEGYEIWTKMDSISEVSVEHFIDPTRNNVFEQVYEYKSVSTSFKFANLEGARFANSCLFFANLDSTNLKDAEFCTLHTKGASWRGVKLNNTSFRFTLIPLYVLVSAIKNDCPLKDIYVFPSNNKLNDYSFTQRGEIVKDSALIMAIIQKNAIKIPVNYRIDTLSSYEMYREIRYCEPPYWMKLGVSEEEVGKVGYRPEQIRSLDSLIQVVRDCGKFNADSLKDAYITFGSNSGGLGVFNNYSYIKYLQQGRGKFFIRIYQQEKQSKSLIPFTIFEIEKNKFVTINELSYL